MKLYLDVDGVIFPFREGPFTKIERVELLHPQKLKLVEQDLLLDSRYPSWLQQLHELFEIVWTTSWDYQANEIWSPRLGLPELPVLSVIHLPRRFSEGLISVKAGAVRAHSEGEPFVWLDDETWQVTNHGLDPYWNGYVPVIDRNLGITEEIFNQALEIGLAAE